MGCRSRPLHRQRSPSRHHTARYRAAERSHPRRTRHLWHMSHRCHRTHHRRRPCHHRQVRRAGIDRSVRTLAQAHSPRRSLRSRRHRRLYRSSPGCTRCRGERRRRRVALVGSPRMTRHIHPLHMSCRHSLGRSNCLGTTHRRPHRGLDSSLQTQSMKRCMSRCSPRRSSRLRSRIGHRRR